MLLPERGDLVLVLDLHLRQLSRDAILYHFIALLQLLNLESLLRDVGLINGNLLLRREKE